MNKPVKTLTHTATGIDADKYDITWSESVTASINKVDAAIKNAPQPNNRDYDTTEQALVSGGTTVGGIGKIVYSLSLNGVYSEDIPTATNADTYSVWYKVADSVNYTGITPAEIKVEIAKATPKIVINPVAKKVIRFGCSNSDIKTMRGLVAITQKSKDTSKKYHVYCHTLRQKQKRVKIRKITAKRSAHYGNQFKRCRL